MNILTYLTTATALITLPLYVEATPRHDELLCEEVAEVVLEAVFLDYLTQEAADHVIDGCYNRFLPNTI